MKAYNFGNIISDIRKKEKITQEDLCEGLCAKSTLCRIESNYKETDKILMDALFQRLGISADKFETIYNKEEYDLLNWRKLIINLIHHNKDDKAKEAIRQFRIKTKNKCSLYEQFIMRAELSIEMKKLKPESDIKNRIKEAIRITIIDFDEKRIMKYLLTHEEILLMAMLAEQYMRVGELEKGEGVLCKLIAQMEYHIIDEEELAKVYPKIIYQLAEWYAKMGDYQKLIICEKGLNILRKNTSFYYFYELLLLRVTGLEKSNAKKDKEMLFRYSSALPVLGQLLKKDHYIYNTVSSPGYLVHEHLKRLREGLHINRETFGDEYYDKSAVSRIENGKRFPTNRWKIMKFYGLETDKFYAGIQSDQFVLHEYRRKFDVFMAKKEYTEAEKVLNVLEQELDKSDKKNEQYIMSGRIVLNSKLKGIDYEVVKKELYKALYLTVPQNAEFSKWPFSRQEISIISNIADAEGMLGDKKKAVKLLETIKNNLEQCKVELLDWASIYTFILVNLATWLERACDYEKAVEISDIGIKMCIQVRNSHNIMYCMESKASCLKILADNGKVDKEVVKKTCIPLLEQIFFIADITGSSFVKEFIYNKLNNEYGMMPRMVQGNILL